LSSLTGPLEIFGIKYPGMVPVGLDLPKTVYDACRRSRRPLRRGDIVVLTHTVVAKAEGCRIELADVKPSGLAEAIADRVGKQPELVEVILKQSKRILRIEGHHLITQSKAGIVCANAGVDQSNVDGGKSVVVVPNKPDEIASKYAREFSKLGAKVSVVITDTLGRPFRIGDVNFAVGSSGVPPLNDLRGKKDLAGRRLRVKRIAIVDELAAAAELVTGSASEGIIGAVIRGYECGRSRKGAAVLQRPFSSSLFI